MVLPKSIRKPNARKKGLKALVYGDTGTGKTLFALSFPKVVALDAEDGYSWYEENDMAPNLVGLVDSQSFAELEKLLKDLRKTTLDEMGTFVIDSETKVYENIQEALQSVEERRAISKGRDVLDANLSVRSWGKIGQLSKKLQNMKIVLATKGFNVVSIAQSKDVTQDVGNGSRIVVGQEANMGKNSRYDYDLVIRLYNDEEGRYMGEIIKDRTNVTSKGDKIENPSYKIWSDVVESKRNSGKVLEKDFENDLEQSKKAYEKEENEKETLKERVKAYLKTLLEEERKEFLKKLVEIGNGKKDPNNFTPEQQAQVIELITN